MLKRLVNISGGVIVWTADWLAEQVRWLLGRTPKSRCVVLAYHSISAKHRLSFAKQMDTLLRIAKPVSADIAALPQDGGHYVAITFDDGLKPILDNALPELRKRAMPATLFIISERLGCQRSWEHYGGEDTSQVKVMSREQLLAVPSDLIKIASHSETHPMLTSLERAELRRELQGSKRHLEGLLHTEVKLFGFPYGAFNEAVLAECRNAGYERVFTGLPIFAFSQPGEFVTGRAVAEPTDWPLEFRLKVDGAYRWLPHAYELKRRIVSRFRGSKKADLRRKTAVTGCGTSGSSAEPPDSQRVDFQR